MAVRRRAVRDRGRNHEFLCRGAGRGEEAIMDGAAGRHDPGRCDEGEHIGAGAGAASAGRVGGVGAEVHNGGVGGGRRGREADGGVRGGDGCGGESGANNQLAWPVGRMWVAKGAGGRGGDESNERLDRGDPIRGRGPSVELSIIRFE